MEKKAVISVIAILLVSYESAGKLIQVPRDTASKVNESTYFNCSTNLVAEKIFWYHGSKYVYTGSEVYEDYKGKVAIDINSVTGSCNLIIHSVQPGDAGEYKCWEDEGSQDHSSAQLVVLEADPDCQSNIYVDIDGVIGQNIFDIPPDEVQLTCNVTYHGNIPPQVEWKKVGDKTSIKDNITSIIKPNRLIYILKLIGDISLDNSSYVCQTTRTTMNRSYKCTSRTFKVIYFVGVDIREQNAVKGDRITCIANNNTFLCTIQWYHDNYACPFPCDDTITAHLIGEYLCTVKCHLRGKDYYSEVLRVFVIEPPTASSLSTSGGHRLVTAVVISVVIFVVIISIVSMVMYIILSRGMKRTTAQIMFVVASSGVSIAMVTIGSMYLKDCPAEQYIPIYLIVGGCVGLLHNLVFSIFKIISVLTSTDNLTRSEFYWLFYVFLFSWYIAGSVWVYRTYGHSTTTDPADDDYCHPLVFWFTYALITAGYIFAGSIIVALIIACC